MQYQYNSTDLVRPTELTDFKKFYTQYDQRRGKDFIETFPSLKTWYSSL